MMLLEKGWCGLGSRICEEGCWNCFLDGEREGWYECKVRKKKKCGKR